jgi:hypothetical protein
MKRSSGGEGDEEASPDESPARTKIGFERAMGFRPHSVADSNRNVIGSH